MTPEEALDFIHSVSWLGSRPGLSRTRDLLGRLGNPQDKLQFVHVAGTNGKGSVCAMTASVLKEAGYRTGLYISPYIMRFNERMSIDGEEISHEELAEITEIVRPHALAMEDPPTEFEIVTAIAMVYYARHRCDVVVLEVGLGGRLDSTNIIAPPACAVIMNIGLDHTGILGDTVEKIAVEKAAIIKRGSGAAVSYPSEEAALAVVKKVCAEQNVALRVPDAAAVERVSDSPEGQIFRYRGGQTLRLPLLGDHQLLNAAVVLETVDALRGIGYSISDAAVAKGMENTRWPARFELVCHDPDFVVDGGHNPQCAETVAAGLARYFPDRKRVLLIGMLADKDCMRVCEILEPLVDEFFTITPD
ncbi:MAG: folylpolyglutamate synthase/dihydrofolate synthase family protein, partial [Eubacteriales bacterium]|nr:folylpolyglutamate synthase/dihydrofolate synthase family protein [Eubacteriales bacterium]